MNEEIFDLTIIGAGPVGLFAAYYAGLRQMKVKMIESLADLGGQLQQLYPEKTIKDLPGLNAIRAKDFISQLKTQLDDIEVTVCRNEKVTTLTKIAEIFHIETTLGTHLSKTVLLTTGGGAFVPRKISLSGAADLEDRTLFYQVHDLETFRNQEVAVLGGGDSAVDWALTLEPIAKSVHLIHRRDNFRALEHSMTELKQSSVTVHTPHTLDAIDANEAGLTLALKHVKEKTVAPLTVDKLLVSYGFINTHDALCDEVTSLEGKIVVDSRGATNLLGLFAAGDGATYPGKIDLIATGLGEAPTAVNNAYFYLHPDEKLQPVHSTSL